MKPPPLQGVTVVAIEQAVAGPFATRQLADLGARVIKIEPRGCHTPAPARLRVQRFFHVNRESLRLESLSAP